MSQEPLQRAAAFRRFASWNVSSALISVCVLSVRALCSRPRLSCFRSSRLHQRLRHDAAHVVRNMARVWTLGRRWTKIYYARIVRVVWFRFFPDTLVKLILMSCSFETCLLEVQSVSALPLPVNMWSSQYIFDNCVSFASSVMFRTRLQGGFGQIGPYPACAP